MSTPDAATSLSATPSSTATDTYQYPHKITPDSDLTTIDPAALALFESYARLPTSEVIPHILRVRRSALAIHPYPCIGQFRFLQFSISLHPSYHSLLARLKSPANPTTNSAPSLLDIGCCLGTDLRKLVYDGVASERLVGLELEQAFIDLGYELFRDRETFKGAIMAADLLDPGMEGLFGAMGGRFEVVHAGSFFHLMGWEEQVVAAKRVVGLMRDEVGVVLVGRQVGNVNPGEYEGGSRGSRYWHDGESWKRMWVQVGKETETEWEAKVWVADQFGEGVGANMNLKDGAIFLTFEVTRIS